MNELFESADVTYSYSRKNLIDDGFLVEVPADLARQAGFRFPVGILREPWEDCVAWSDADSERQVPQDQTGRLWDLLSVLRIRAKACGGDTVFFTIARIPRDGKSEKPKNVQLKAVIGPGDDPRPVITVMFPNQD